MIYVLGKRVGGVLLGWGILAAIPASAVPASVEIHPLFSPQVVTGSGGARHLAYGLEITNFYTSTGPIDLSAIDVFGDNAKTSLAHYSGDGLSALLLPGVDLTADRTLTVKGGGSSAARK